MDEATKRITDACKFKFSPHDLRRTCATHLGELGVSRDTIRLVLNHADRSVTGIYDRHHRLPEKRRALERWGARLQQILESKAAQIMRIG